MKRHNSYLDLILLLAYHIGLDGQQVHCKSICLYGKHHGSVVNLVDQDLRFLSPTTSSQQLVIIEELHEHHAIIMDTSYDVDALKSFLVPDMDGWFVAILARGDQVG